MRLAPTFAAAAGLSLLTIASAGAQENCRAQITALNAALAEHYPNLFGVAAGDVEPGDDAPEVLSGDPPETLATPTSEDVPTSVMPGAGPEIRLAEEEAAATPGDEQPPGTLPDALAAVAGDSTSGDPLPEDAEARAENVTEEPATGRVSEAEAPAAAADSTPAVEALAESDEEAPANGAEMSLQDQVDRILTLRTVAEERLSTGHEDLCRQYVEQAMAIARGDVE